MKIDKKYWRPAIKNVLPSFFGAGLLVLLTPLVNARTAGGTVEPIIRWVPDMNSFICSVPYVEGTLAYCVPPGILTKSYKSPQEALSAVLGNLQIHSGYGVNPFGLVPLASEGYLNGTARYQALNMMVTKEGADFLSYEAGVPTFVNGSSSGLTFSGIGIDATAICPIGSSMATTWNGTTETSRCTINIGFQDPAPNSCPDTPKPVYATSGLKRQDEVDYRGPNLLNHTRTYRSDYGDFNQSVQRGVLEDISVGNVKTSCYWGAYQPYGSVYDYACFSYISGGTGEVHLIQSNGDVKTFTVQNGGYVPSDGNINEKLSFSTVNGVATWYLRTAENMLETYGNNGQLLSREGADGGKLTYGYVDISPPADGLTPLNRILSIKDAFGHGLTYSYDSNGALKSLIDPAGGEIKYNYDEPSANCVSDTSGSCKRLTSVQYQDGVLRRYYYNELDHVAVDPETENNATIKHKGFLTGIVDERGVRLSDYYYDSNGGVWRSGWGGFNYTLKYDSLFQTTVTDPVGNSRVIKFVSLLHSKYKTGQSQPAGSGCSASTSAASYDTQGNTVSEDDFNGTRTCRAFDLSRNLETSRVEGLSTAATCTSVTKANVQLQTGARKISSTWHPDWRLQIVIAEPGKLTTRIYNGQPDPFNGNAVASCAPNAAVLADGTPIAVLCKQVEQATTDTDGHLGTSAVLQSSVANRVHNWTYNATGQVLTATDPLNHTSTYAYYSDTTADHTLGDLQTVTNALGQVTTFNQYNPHGQLLQSTDPNGVVTLNSYDLRQRLLTTSVDGKSTSYSYDAAGQLTRITQPDASWIGYEYDAAHRQTAVLDNLGNRIEYTLDNVGNRTNEVVKDPSGTLSRQLTRSFDALKRVQQVTGRE